VCGRWWGLSLQSPNGDPIATVAEEEAGQESSIEPRSMSVVDSNLVGAEDGYQLANEIEDLIFSFLCKVFRQFWAEKLNPVKTG
jgi:hypothetical protein